MAHTHALTTEHVDQLWAAALGKHEGLVRIVYEAVADLAQEVSALLVVVACVLTPCSQAHIPMHAHTNARVWAGVGTARAPLMYVLSCHLMVVQNGFTAMTLVSHRTYLRDVMQRMLRA